MLSFLTKGSILFLSTNALRFFSVVALVLALAGEIVVMIKYIPHPLHSRRY